jgi:hypothetical protein
MGITEIIKEVDNLEPVDRKRLMSHLVLRRLHENESYREELARRLEDKNPEHWISLEELKKKAGKED